MKETKLIVLVLVAVAATLGGCVGKKMQDPAYFVQPNIAVKFQNRAQFPLKWDLGDGMAEILIDRLVQTQRFHVIGRKELAHLLDEVRLQSSGITRPEGRVTPGRAKNVQYLIQGTVTDFGHVSTSKAFVGGSSLGVFGSSAAAVMGLTFSVMDLESNEIVFSQKLEKAIRANSTEVAGSYKGVALGGSVFFKTPLGKATAEVMDEAAELIVRKIGSRRWWPRIADISADGAVILNGGKDRRVMIGYEYDVLEQGNVVVDPVTGDKLGRLQPTILARIRVTELSDRYCTAQFMSGDVTRLKKGLVCRPCQTPKVQSIRVQSSSTATRRKRNAGGLDPLRRH